MAMRWALKKRAGWVLAGLLGLVVTGLLAGTIILAIKWPFTKANIAHELEDVSASKVEIRSFRATYFPRPGCVAEGVTFRHGQDASGPPFISIANMRIESAIAGLFSKHIARITAQGVHVTVAHGMQEGFPGAKTSKIVVQDLSADNSQLEFASADPKKKALVFNVHKFRLHNVGTKLVASFDVALSNPLPPGEVRTHGTVGPWQQHREQTPISGEYEFTNADLGTFDGIGGKLNSNGKFNGKLGQLQASGSVQVPDFQVAGSSNQTELKSEFSALINTRNGDVDLQRVLARLRQSTLLASGKVAAQNGEKRTAELSLSCQNGRIEDFLRLFTKSKRSPMSGALSFNAQAKIPGGETPFLRRVQLAGDFGIADGEFSKPNTQQSVDRLSAGSRGQKEPEDSGLVLSDLKGHAVLREGIAMLSNLTFSVPGALAEMHGTYNVINQKVDLHGDLKTQKSLANSTTGIKSAVLHVLSPFFKKKHGEKTPVKVTGTYSHPSFGLDLGSGKGTR